MAKKALIKKIDKSNNEDRANKAFRLIDKSSKKILELGTGNGELFEFLTKRGYKVSGIDVEVKDHIKKKGYNVKRFDLNKGLPFGNSSFDVVIGLEVLEHLYNPYEMMKEIRRVLKPNGQAIISMPNSASFFSRIGQLYEPRLKNLDIYWHHHQPSITSIRNLVSTQLKIENEVFILSFRRWGFLNFISKLLLNFNKEFFAGDFMVKARKED